mmetsp:Transcript_30558/g.46603  ORF Transcript_30558/g.46603 Transcript_30558/m.46603 type:complete len:668 (-) Transcript_30558:86-2089(-)
MINQKFFVNILVASLVFPQQGVDASCDLNCHGDSTCVSGSATFADHATKPDGSPLDMHKAKEINGSHCECPHGWTGVLCDRIYSSCDDDHKCYNGAECIPGLTDFYDNEQLFCDCTTAKDETGLSYVGKFCEQPMAVQCGREGIFCTNGGECPTTSQTNCDCSGDYFGPHCEFEGEEPVEDSSINDKDISPVPPCTLQCKNQGTCVLGSSGDTYGVHDLDHLYDTDTNSVQDFMSCLCLPGFGGKLCNIEKTECGAHHCFHGGTCLSKEDSNGDTKNHCDCSTALESGHSYAGRFCQFKSNEFCGNSENDNGQIFCVNGGRCLGDDVDGCSCPPDFYGLSCEFKREPSNFTAPEIMDSIINPSPLDPVINLTPNESENHNNEGEPMLLQPVKAVCNLQCMNGGVCNKGAKNLGAISHLSYVEELSESYNDDFEHCVCQDGYVGLQCEHEIEICPSGTHVCMYGSKCVKFGVDEEDGCDCSSSPDFDLNGQSCEHKSSHPGATLCTIGNLGAARPRSFCLNGGSCNAYVNVNEAHAGCACVGEWVGPHCELHRNNAPVVIIEEKSNAINSILAIGIISLMVSLFVYLYTCRRNRKFQEELVRREESIQRLAMQRAAPAPPRRHIMNVPYKDVSKATKPRRVNLATGEPEVDIGPPRDEDGHELHNVII